MKSKMMDNSNTGKNEIKPGFEPLKKNPFRNYCIFRIAMTEKKEILLELLHHRGQNHIAIKFPYNAELIKVIKQIPEVTFSGTHKCWYAPHSKESFDSIFKIFHDAKIWVNYSKLKDNFEQKEIQKENLFNEAQEQALRMIEQKLNLKGYSALTRKNYLSQFGLFLKFFGDVSPVDLTEIEIRNYLLYLVEKKKVSRSSQNQAINAIKFFYEVVLRQERKVYYLERPMKERRLPEVLSQEEVAMLFTVTQNIKHRAMLMMIYSAGLRRGELLRLRVGDVDFHRNVVFIKGSKGRKDRQSILAKSLEPILKKYLETHKPGYWMFEGEAGGKYGERSIARVLESACAKTKIKKEITLHTLRHSFATHLLEAGTSTRYIQELLGHESPLTTEIYTHVSRLSLSKIQSPLDHIVQQNFLEKGDEKLWSS
jgi:site-specific recombinase XerD